MSSEWYLDQMDLYSAAKMQKRYILTEYIQYFIFSLNLA